MNLTIIPRFTISKSLAIQCPLVISENELKIANIWNFLYDHFIDDRSGKLPNLVVKSLELQVFYSVFASK